MRTAFLLTALLAATPLAAQLPIRVGQTLTGRLVQTDQKFSDGSRYKLYTFAGNKGDTVAVDLVSDDFDANLLIADASGNSLARNDDSGEKCNARLSFVPPSTGNYRLYANSSAAAELGEYKVTLARGAARAAADTVCRGFGQVAGLIEVGQSITGNLTTDDPEMRTDSTYFQRWVLPVKPLQSFTVDLESSDFDAYVWLTRGRGDKIVANDDGGTGCNARVVYTAQDDHPVRVVVNTASRPPRQTGHFTLRVSPGESPTEAKGNCRVNTAVRPGTVQQTASVSPQSSSAASASLPVIRVGETLNGALTSRDSLYPDNSYYKFYQFTPPAGRAITIDLSSDDVDPVLIVRGDDLDQSIIDDNGGPGCSARVSRTFPSRGPYRILVNTSASPERQTGSYSLSIIEGTKPVQSSAQANVDCRPPQGGTAGSARSIEVGQSRQARISRSDEELDDTTYVQIWTISGRAGTAVTVDLESDDFDSFLMIRGPGITGGQAYQDDDSGGNCNARLTVTFPQTGEYRIAVNTIDKHGTGGFTLSVTNGSKPKSVARCNRNNQ